MAPPMKAVNLNAMARPLAVDQRISLSYYYRIADNLLRQASIYREEQNLVDLYVILLRYSSLVCETIPSHHKYHAATSMTKNTLKKKLLDVVNELELLKPEVERQVDEINKEHTRRLNAVSYPEKVTSVQMEQRYSGSIGVHRPSAESYIIAPSEPSQLDKQFQKLAISLPQPKEETLSRHSFLGPNGLRAPRSAPPISTKTRVQYPSNSELSQSELSSLLPDHYVSDQKASSMVTYKDGSKTSNLAMESVLSLDDGRWAAQENFLQLSVRQPPPPPVLAQVHSKAIPPSKVADPTPGPAVVSESGRYQHLHVPVDLMECFLRVAEANTAKNLETCGVLAGSLKKRTFYVTTLIIPKQTATSDSCQATNEEEIFEAQDKQSLFTLGWIHTHPTQTCFLSSIDLHNHYSYQVMLPEAIAIVMAPTDTTSRHGIFHLTDPSGMSVMQNCRETGFHPHEEPADGSPIYEHCAHVYMNPKVKFEVVDLRKV